MDRYVPLPPLPQRVSRLNELAYDLWWSWNAQAREVFRDLDYPLWRFTDHNPVLLLHLVEPERLEHAAADPPFLSLYDDAIAGLDAVRGGARTWWARQSGPSQPIAWVSPEFALHQSLPVNASRLGVLAGDFCREASDLEVPIVGRCSSCFPLSSPGSALPAHLSTADGWWMDGFTGANGWMIDGGRMRDAGAQDAANARALYRLIEEDLVRAFYERDRAGVPDRWAALMAASVATTVPRFSARRMVKAFVEEAYLPALRAGV